MRTARSIRSKAKVLTQKRQLSNISIDGFHPDRRALDKILDATTAKEMEPTTTMIISSPANSQLDGKKNESKQSPTN